MAKKTNRQYAIALYEATKDLNDKLLDQILAAFAKLLTGDHKLKQANNIINEFVNYSKQRQGIEQIEITSARKLEPDLVEEIKKKFGDKVEETMVVNPQIIGGIKVKVGDKILDSSLKKQLIRLKQQLS